MMPTEQPCQLAAQQVPLLSANGSLAAVIGAAAVDDSIAETHVDAMLPRPPCL